MLCKRKGVQVFTDLTGMRFDKLAVIKKANINNEGLRWLCICDCGNYAILNQHTLLRKDKKVKSCGCVLNEYWRKRLTTHGGSDTRLYRIWRGMKSRCYLKNVSNYKYYGGKGVKVCDEWLDFSNFQKWAFQNGYAEDLSIDRIDENGNYEPSNCRWVKQNTQVRNRSMSRMITWNGKTQLIVDWARELGFNYETLRIRINKWGVEKAFTTKIPRISQHEDFHESLNTRDK